MTTPGPKAIGIPITDEGVENDNDEDYEEEEEADKGAKQPHNTAAKQETQVKQD